MKILVLSEARDDLRHGYSFYESQRLGLGGYFRASLASDIESLRVHGGVHPRFFGLHRALSKRFPFAIYYDVNGDTLRVFAVLDCRRSPA
jgi:hypothetical protein